MTVSYLLFRRVPSVTSTLVLLAYFATASVAHARGPRDEDEGMDMYLAIDGVTGDADNPQFKGQMEVLAWSWGASSTGCSGRGRHARCDDGEPTPGELSSSSKPSIQDLSMTKYQDAATAQILTGLAQAKTFKKAVLTVVRRSSKTKPYLRITLENVTITSLSTGGSGGEDRFTENVTLSFEKVRFENAPVTGKDTGELHPPFIYDATAPTKQKDDASPKGDPKTKK